MRWMKATFDRSLWQFLLSLTSKSGRGNDEGFLTHEISHTVVYLLLSVFVVIYSTDRYISVSESHNCKVWHKFQLMIKFE